jgi:hypothetical protein
MDDRFTGLAQAGPLARGYRRLLACYPAWYRRAHEDEMLAVLMAAAPPGQRRPGIAEAADLLWGALRIRCQPSRAGAAEPVWRDALAVLSVVVPLVVVVRSVVKETQFLLFPPSLGPFAHVAHGFSLRAPLNALAVPVALWVLALLGLRLPRTAALAGAGLVIWQVSDARGLLFGIAIGDVPVTMAAALLTVALVASRGLRRGLQLLTWKHAALVLIVTILVGTSVIPMDRPALLVVRFIVIAVIGAGMMLTSSLGRWLVALLAIAAYPFLLFAGLSLFPAGFRASLPFGSLMAAYYLPPLALLLLAVMAARRASRRPAGPLGASRA